MADGTQHTDDNEPIRWAEVTIDERDGSTLPAVAMVDGHRSMDFMRRLVERVRRNQLDPDT